MTLPVLPPKDRAPVIAQVARFLETVYPGKAVRVKVEIAKRERTNPQNAYLFGVAYPLISKEMGYDVEEVHEYMCGRHFGWVDKVCPKTPRNPQGLESKPFRSTTRDEGGGRSVLSTVEFSDFVETVKRIAANVGIFIPDPTELSAGEEDGQA